MEGGNEGGGGRGIREEEKEQLFFFTGRSLRETDGRQSRLALTLSPAICRHLVYVTFCGQRRRELNPIITHVLFDSPVGINSRWASGRLVS